LPQPSGLVYFFLRRTQKYIAEAGVAVSNALTGRLEILPFFGTNKLKSAFDFLNFGNSFHGLILPKIQGIKRCASIKFTE
jgi:hypothetical protein